MPVPLLAGASNLQRKLNLLSAWTVKQHYSVLGILQGCAMPLLLLPVPFFPGSFVFPSYIIWLATTTCNIVGQDLSKEYVDELIEFQDRSLLINSSKFEYFGEPAGIYYEIQEVTRIRHLEQSLSKKLRNKGLVTRYTFDSIQAKSTKMQECLQLSQRLALSNLTILIMGESGTGKELLAHAIHAASPRSIYPFVAINCASVPENLLESELFGYEAGSFTGAVKEGKPGLFEQANNGTIFLDEIGDMPLPLQVRLLRVLQERQIMRVGSQSIININIRIVAATNKDLFAEVQKGLFRQDLFYRLNVLPIIIPPLRERQEDILHLFYFFMK
ncbi:Anaerobic nitric oxide reductase transcription regulator NorR [Sporomusa acidovorans DSM 3132]|uniref:Anaerobic nitric oxide reductase transcription regulator NorR n=1 Tax=Sporomusa acidovorans (strain ATCC 49682 / DSM 3132 / Mol) TaxID=1123286 RepID=A0ABZ3J5T7_SPOA4|nr:nitrogen regulation protein NR(I) [Sporomusa acidovorans DSM 3132]SDF17940.1 Sigma-54 interaction domain-containing protein [Sporomusa acidovorans]